MSRNICATARGCRGVKVILELSRDLINENVRFLDTELSEIHNNFRDERVQKADEIVQAVKTNMKSVEPDIEQVCANLERYAQFLET